MSDKKLKNYFEDFDEKLFKKIIQMKDDLSNYPFLFKIGKGNYYKVPPNYFERIDIQRYIKNEVRRISVFKSISLVASVVLLISFWILFDNNKLDQSESFTEQELAQFFIQNENDFNNDLLLEFDATSFEEDMEDLEEFSDDFLSTYVETILEDISTEELATVVDLNNNINF